MQYRETDLDLSFNNITICLCKEIHSASAAEMILLPSTHHQWVAAI